MTDLITEPAELHFTIKITRKETGETETYDMVGHVISENEEELTDGINTLNSGS